MSAIDFPASPSIGDIYPISGERQWRWTGEVWQTVTTRVGSQGDKGGLRYNFDSSVVMTEPSTGKIRFNNAIISTVSSIAVNSSTIEGSDVSEYFIALAESLTNEPSIIKYYLIITSNVNEDPTYTIFAVKDIQDNGAWLEFDAEYITGTIPDNNDTLSISLSRVGDTGDTGPATTISLGTVETSLPGEDGLVSITGPAGDQVLSFVIPQGPTGPETSITVGTVIASEPGSDAEVSITGPAGDQEISFVIPRGEVGPTGPTGPLDLPSYTGNEGKFLTTDGSDAFWETVDALPPQEGNSGKYLTTDGTDPEWAFLSGGSAAPEPPESGLVDGSIWLDTDGEIQPASARIRRWTKTATAGQTEFTGASDGSGPNLDYKPASEQVFLNGVQLVRGIDYSAGDGESVVLASPAKLGDILQVINPSFIATTISGVSEELFENKGDILVASDIQTPVALSVGANGQFLMANDSTASGIEWAEVDVAAIQDNYTLSLMGAI